MFCPNCREPVEAKGGACPHCGASPVKIGPGRLLAERYEIQALLGKGGMGEVFRAKDRELDEIVAVKVLRSELASAEEAARRFRAETRLARRVRHPNVCAIHEFGREGPYSFLTMEFVEGTDLQKLARGARGLLPDEAFEIGKQVLEALGAIHEVGIVHRDLKTSNVMLDDRGRVRVMDFGIAKQFGADAGEGLTQAGSVLGTPEYMSPEQLRGEDLDARSDLYAMGVILFELFAGDVPFRSTTPLSTALKHLQEPPPLEGPRAARLPKVLVPVLRRALSKSRDERYASAKEMASALGEAHNEYRSARGPAEETPSPEDVATFILRAPAATTLLDATPPPRAVQEDFDEDLGAGEADLVESGAHLVLAAFDDGGAPGEQDGPTPTEGAVLESLPEPGARPAAGDARALDGFEIDFAPSSEPADAGPGLASSPLSAATQAAPEGDFEEEYS